MKKTEDNIKHQDALLIVIEYLIELRDMQKSVDKVLLVTITASCLWRLLGYTSLEDFLRHRLRVPESEIADMLSYADYAKIPVTETMLYAGLTRHK